MNEFIKTPKLDELFEKYALEVGEDVSHDDFGFGYALEVGEDVSHDDFGFGSTDTGNVSHIVPTIHPHVKIGSRNLVGHT